MQRLTDLFLAAALRDPAATALIHASGTLSYGELRDRARETAAAVAASGSAAPVALTATKTPETVIAMLGCLLAGVPYIPIDPAAPPARRELILRDSGARPLPAPGGHGRTTPSHLANVLYTSGSTGTPKGVLTTHHNAVTFLRWAQELIGVTERDVVACYAPLHFDMHVFDLFGTLSAGAAILLLDDRTILFPQAVGTALRTHRATVMYAVPSAWTGLLRSTVLTDGGLPDLHTVMYSGEEFPVRPLRELSRALPGARIVNIYGPVETNAVTALDVTAEHLRLDRIPIGLPFGRSRVFVVDDRGAPITEPGVEGEITVHTATMCEGYLGDPDRTAASRLTVHSDGQALETYRTGDFGCWDAEGLLHFRGRRDGRIKTRGFRVELGEVEARLRAHPDTADAVVTARPHPERTNELVAFVVPRRGATLTAPELTAWCREFLAPYMVPRELRLLADLPRTGTGKADRMALRELAATPEEAAR
ncbi:amino acid adenylation domain-containing protein [Kitasatospora sp. NPDC049285]|uniref:amino acid adenylation domain-containing protein n=1 Tax=Kitasatospora sp. NPDC049285 TaxID=3157096 RepID=UPI0034484C97